MFFFFQHDSAMATIKDPNFGIECSIEKQGYHGQHHWTADGCRMKSCQRSLHAYQTGLDRVWCYKQGKHSIVNSGRPAWQETTEMRGESGEKKRARQASTPGRGKTASRTRFIATPIKNCRVPFWEFFFQQPHRISEK